MYNVIEEKCGTCYFWLHSDLEDVSVLTELRLASTGTCCRFPQKVEKHRDEGCGEHRSRKLAQMLREVEKDEANT